MHPEYYWWIAAGILLILEAIVPGPLVCASLGVAAGVAGLVAYLTPYDWLAWVAFFVVLAAVFQFVRRQVRRLTEIPRHPLMTDTVLEQEAVVTETIDPETGTGYVRVQGEYWRATSARRIAAGERVRVREVQDNTVVVE